MILFSNVYVNNVLLFKALSVIIQRRLIAMLIKATHHHIPQYIYLVAHFVNNIKAFSYQVPVPIVVDQVEIKCIFLCPRKITFSPVFRITLSCCALKWTFCSNLLQSMSVGSCSLALHNERCRDIRFHRRQLSYC